MTVPKKLAVVPQHEPTTLARQDEFPRDACLDWMRERVDPKHGRYQAIAFSLSHIDARAVGDAFTDITHVMVPVDPKTGALPQGLTMILETAADEFSRAASAHCAALFTNRQGFVIKGHHRGGMVEVEQADGTKVKEEEDPLTVPPRVTFPFSVTPPPGVRENYEGNERPTNEGALGAFQRTLDTNLRTMQAQQEKLVKSMAEWNESLLGKLTETLEINISQSRMLQDAEDRKVTRISQANKDAFELEIQSSIKDVVETKVMPIVELLVKAKLGILPASPALGQGQAPPDPAALGAALKALDLDPTQLGNIMAELRPEQNQMLRPMLTELSQSMPKAAQHELLKAVEERTEAKKAALAKKGEPK